LRPGPPGKAPRPPVRAVPLRAAQPPSTWKPYPGGVAISVAIIVVGSVFLLVGAPLAINSRGFAHHLANWLTGLDDRWYFLPGKPASPWRARFLGCMAVCVGAGWIAGGILRL